MYCNVGFFSSQKITILVGNPIDFSEELERLKHKMTAVSTEYITVKLLNWIYMIWYFYTFITYLY